MTSAITRYELIARSISYGLHANKRCCAEDYAAQMQHSPSRPTPVRTRDAVNRPDCCHFIGAPYPVLNRHRQFLPDSQNLSHEPPEPYSPIYNQSFYRTFSPFRLKWTDQTKLGLVSTAIGKKEQCEG